MESNYLFLSNLYDQVHSEFHLPDKAAIIAESLVTKMKEEIQKDPLVPVGRIKEKILREELHESGKYSREEAGEILSSVPQRVDCTLHNFRVSALGTDIFACCSTTNWVFHKYSVKNSNMKSFRKDLEVVTKKYIFRFKVEKV